MLNSNSIKSAEIVLTKKKSSKTSETCKTCKTCLRQVWIMWFSPQKWLLTTILLSMITIKVSQSEIQFNSKCGDSFDKEEIMSDN